MFTLRMDSQNQSYIQYIPGRLTVHELRFESLVQPVNTSCCSGLSKVGQWGRSRPLNSDMYWPTRTVKQNSAITQAEVLKSRSRPPSTLRAGIHTLVGFLLL